MKLSATEQEQLVQLLNKIYFDIVAIETTYQLTVGSDDFRPRVDYFHDAVRAYTAKDFSRLAVELLTYDLQCLRYICDMPLAPFQPHAGVLSPHKDLLTKQPGALVAKAARPDRETKERLVELYQYYAILFSALLKPAAESDVKDRTDIYHQDIATIQALLAQMEATASADKIIHTANHVEDEILRAQLQHFLQTGKHKKPEEVKKLTQSLKSASKKKKETITQVEDQHMRYGLAQLSIYENGRDVVKKMATQGMNLVGKFVENAIAETKREIGR